MRRLKWTRLAGLCALLALGFPAVGVLGHYAESGYTQDQRFDPMRCALGLLLVILFLQTDPPAAELPAPAAMAWLVEEPDRPLAAALPRLHPSRGPPA